MNYKTDFDKLNKLSRDKYYKVYQSLGEKMFSECIIPTVYDFATIDENLDLVNKIEGINEVEPMTHCLDDFVYELREDIVQESVPIEDLLANSDDTTDSEIVVPKVVG